MSDGFGRLGTPLRKLPRLPRKQQRPENIRGFPLRFQQHKLARDVGPGPIPEGYDGPTVSVDEWIFYWASNEVLTPEQDARVGPWNGDKNGVLWSYQLPYHATGAIGGAVIDFVYYLADEQVGVRIQSQQFHVFADQAVKAYDFLQLTNLEKRFRVEDVYSQDYIEDTTGQAAIIQLKKVLAGGESTNPISAGTAITTRINRL